MPTTVLWFRRDLRLRDHPALEQAAAAAGRSGRVLALFVIDPRLARPTPRTTFLLGCLDALTAATEGGLLVRVGRPEQVIPEVAADVGAASVHVTAETTPFGRSRDRRVARALADRAGIELVGTGTPYAVAPGAVRNAAGDPYRVFTPFRRAWLAHGWPAPADREPGVAWVHGLRSDRPPAQADLDTALPAPGEDAALTRWRAFRDSDRLSRYAAERDLPAEPATSRLSPYLHLGCIHPRTMLADLSGRHEEGAATFRSELAWREFYADVLWHRPDSAWHSLDTRTGAVTTDTGPAAREMFDAWREGRTGYPIVDAGMRQLTAEGWMHNRVRMITASFLVKDLHLPWQWGAGYFLDRLVDGDVASNNHGWQWTAGTGTDAAPYFRVFSPVRQAKRFDPDGRYVRRYVAELREVADAYVHEPWLDPGGQPVGYPPPIVDHGEERAEALRRYRTAKEAAPGAG